MFTLSPRPNPAVTMTAAPVCLLRPPRPPFRFDLALAYLRRSPLEVLDWVEDGAYRRALELDGRPRLLEVRTPATLNSRYWKCACWTDRPARMNWSRPRSSWRAASRIADDLTSLDALALADPAYGALLGRVRGLRALLMPSPFEALVWAIIGQQINIAFAYKLKRALVEQFGRTIEHDGRIYRLFPTAERLAALRPGRAAATAVQRAEGALHHRASSVAGRRAA